MHNSTTLVTCRSLLIANILRLKSPTLTHISHPFEKPQPSRSTAHHRRHSHAATCTKTTTTAAAEDSVVENEKESEKEKKIREPAAMLDICVGRVVKAWRNAEADSLYVEEFDVGEAEPRVICSGLVNYIPLDQLEVFPIIPRYFCGLVDDVSPLRGRAK